MLRKDIPDGNTSLTVFPCQPNLPPFRDLTQIMLLTRLMTEICRCRAFHTVRTANNLRKFVRISHTDQEKSITASRSKILNSQYPLLLPSVRAHTFDVLICINILLICSILFWKFAATILNLQQLYFICSNFTLFAERFFNLQQLYFICSNSLICSMSLVGHRTCGTQLRKISS